MSQQIVTFGGGSSDSCTSDSHAESEQCLGWEAALVCKMAKLGVAMPSGFCVAATLAHRYSDRDSGHEITEPVRSALDRTGIHMEREFANLDRPLLVSLRSSSTLQVANAFPEVQFLGMNDEIVQIMAFVEGMHVAWDSYRRLILTFARSVHAVKMEPFQSAANAICQRLDAKCTLGRKHEVCDIPTCDLQELIRVYKALYEEQVGQPFPQDPYEQLRMAMGAAATSFGAQSVIIQGMVFSNHSCQSAAGLMALRGHHSFGHTFQGVWLPRAMPNDIVFETFGAPRPVNISACEQGSSGSSLEQEMPLAYAELMRYLGTIEHHFGAHFPGRQGMWCVEFALHQGGLWLLQCRDVVGTPFMARAIPDIRAISTQESVASRGRRSRSPSTSSTGSLMRNGSSRSVSPVSYKVPSQTPVKQKRPPRKVSFSGDCKLHDGTLRENMSNLPDGFFDLT